jgi:hypothetical protein
MQRLNAIKHDPVYERPKFTEPAELRDGASTKVHPRYKKCFAVKKHQLRRGHCPEIATSGGQKSYEIFHFADRFAARP